MNPYKLKNVFEYLTSNNQLLKRKLKLGTSDIPIPPKRKDVIDIEAINRFNKDNPRVDTTNIQPVVKQSTIKQSNVGEIDEGVIQGAFDTATMEARDGGYPAPVYEAFKKRYLKRNMKADGGRIGYNEGSKLTDFLDVQASGTKSGKQQIQGAPEGITSDKETLNAIVRLDVPISEKINLIGDLQYGKFRDKIEYNDNEIFLEDAKSYRDRNIGLDYNRGGEGFSGSATVGDEGPAFNIRYKKSFADGGMLVQPSDDGSRPGYAVQKLSTKEVQALYKDLPDNVYIMVQKRGKKQIPEYTFRATVSGNRLGKKNWSMNLKATPENKKTIIEATEAKLNEYYPKRLNRESYAKLRLKPENRTLKGEDFAKKLNTEGYTTSIGGEWNRNSVYNFDLSSARSKERIADDLGFFKKRTVKEAKEIIKKYSGGKHFLKNKNLTDAQITTKAATYEAQEKFQDSRGTGKAWPRGKQNKRKVWTNIYQSYVQGGRFKLINEKELADADGKVNWRKDLNWRKAKFKDTKSGKTFTYSNLESMVDKHGGGYQKAVKAYNDNAILNQTTFKGKTLNDWFREGMLKKEYETLIGKKVNLNDSGLLKYIGDKKPYYSFVEAHHFKGIKDNPFDTEPSFRYANRKQGNFQNSYDKAIKSGNPNRIAKAKETYIQNMNQLSDEMGGIRFKMDNKFIGKKGTPESIIKAAGDVIGMTKNKQMQIIQNIQSYSKLAKCKVAAADGGRIGFAYSDECLRDGLKEQKIEAQKGNKKAAQELVQVGKVATRAGLLKNLLGPGAILGEAVYEGAVIGNKVLGGTPKDIAWAESYLSYLDPRKYTPEGLDPLKMKREDMITREDFNDPDYAEGESKTIDGPNANILRSGFAAQDQVSAFNEAVNERERAKKARRLDQYNPAAADVREQGRFVDQSKDIISSDAFQEASKQAQEYIQAQTGENMFPYNQLKQSIGKYESGEARDLRREREKEMQALGGTYQDYKNPFTKDQYENFARQEGYLDSDLQYTDEFFTNSILNPLKFEQLMKTPGFTGASEKFASGGIASLTKTIPPESGPTPHGLRYQYNNVKKI